MTKADIISDVFKTQNTAQNGFNKTLSDIFPNDSLLDGKKIRVEVRVVVNPDIRSEKVYAQIELESVAMSTLENSLVIVIAIAMLIIIGKY